MNLAAINLLNIGLMLVAAAIAFVVPFETFLLAYAVLGPLHYLTQISWLHERQYFTRLPRDWIPLALLTVVVTICNLIAMGDPDHAEIGMLAVDVMVWCLLWSLLLVLTPDRSLRVFGGTVAAIALFLLHGQSHPLYVIGGVFLPTVIHVFVFTGLFVAVGAIKGRSATAWLSLLVFVGCGVATLMAKPGNLGYEATHYAKESYRVLSFMHTGLIGNMPLLGPVTPTGTAFPPFATFDEVFTDETSVRLGRFLGFAYTYHYLNWFSKTSVIRWHKVPLPRLLTVIAVWLVSVGLYALDYALGLKWLLLLSLAHVILEFPLDWKTAIAIPKGLAGGKAPAAAPRA